jgi:xanthine/uracil/vitamin C permease (AzgA family)
VLASIGSFEEAGTQLAVLGVGLELVLEMRNGTSGVTAMQLEGTVTIFATELGVTVEQGIDEGLHFPEWLITASGADAASFYFTFK